MKEYGFTHFVGRIFNQDPIENFFGQIRQHRPRNIKPKATVFQGYYKRLLVNFVVDNNLKGTNCEADFSSNFLVNVKALLECNANQFLPRKPSELLVLPNNFSSQKPLSDSATHFINAVFSYCQQ